MSRRARRNDRPAFNAKAALVAVNGSRRCPKTLIRYLPKQMSLIAVTCCYLPPSSVAAIQRFTG
jgi:hypothetical protein